MPAEELESLLHWRRKRKHSSEMRSAIDQSQFNFAPLLRFPTKIEGKGEGDQRRQGTAINIELQRWIEIDFERERLPSYKIEYFQG